jgi:hypothetical protein
MTASSGTPLRNLKNIHTLYKTMSASSILNSVTGKILSQYLPTPTPTPPPSFKGNVITFTPSQLVVNITEPGVYLLNSGSISGCQVFLTSPTDNPANLGSTYIFLLSDANSTDISVAVALSGYSAYVLPNALSASNNKSRWNALWYGDSAGVNADVAYTWAS